MSVPSSRPGNSLNPPINRTEPTNTARNRTGNRTRRRQPVQRQATGPPARHPHASHSDHSTPSPVPTISVPSSRPHKALNPPINRTEPTNTARNRPRNRTRRRQPFQRQATDPPARRPHASRSDHRTSSSISNDHLQNGESPHHPNAAPQVSSNPQPSDPPPDDLPSRPTLLWTSYPSRPPNHAIPNNGPVEAASYGYGMYGPAEPSGTCVPYNPNPFGNSHIVLDNPNAGPSAIIPASSYRFANYQAQRDAAYQSQPYPYGPNSFPHAHAPYYAHLQSQALSIQSQHYHSQAQRASYLRRRTSLLEQRVFYWDDRGRSIIPDQQAEILVKAISIAHRLVFSQRSLQILSGILGGSSHYGRNGNGHGDARIASIFELAVERDGRYVIVDRETRQSGLILNNDPCVLRVNATLVKQATRGRDQSKIRLHIFYLASVLAHLLCRSIQIGVGIRSTQDIAGWERQFFGGRIKRIAALPGLWGAIEGEIEHLRVVFDDSYGWPASVILPGATIERLFEGVGCPGWERSLPLGIHPDAILRGQHERELPFGEVSVDREDRPENCTPPAQMKDWIRDIGDVIADPRGWELVAGYGIRQWDKVRGRWVHAE